MSIKVEGFLKDVGGASRIVEMRRENYKNASPTPDPKDFVRDLADALHPAAMKFKVVSIKDVSLTAKTFRLESLDGHIPVFQCGQYMILSLKIGNSVLNRPYSISSAPFEGRGDKPFIEITVRRNKSYVVPDYLFEHVKVGDVFDGNMPFGTFYWEPLRDQKNIVAIAGGSGITPFYAMAKEIAYGKMKDCKLTILYGSVKSNDIILKDEFEKICGEYANVKVIHILSDDESWQGEKGFITRELIEKYSLPDCTYMVCGPAVMLDIVKKALKEMNVAKNRLRHDIQINPGDVTKLPRYPQGTEKNTYKITVVRGIQTDVIDANAAEPVAVALERAGIAVDTHCRNGECGFCRSQLLEGDIFVSPIGDGRRLMDKELGWFHPCSSWPVSDLKIKIPIM
jgi:ferredoxin-NADP reductase/ferredoxin